MVTRLDLRGLIVRPSAELDLGLRARKRVPFPSSQSCSLTFDGPMRFGGPGAGGPPLMGLIPSHRLRSYALVSSREILLICPSDGKGANRCSHRRLWALSLVWL